MQPTLAPAPPQMQSSAQDIVAADNDLRAQLALAINPSHSAAYADGLPARHLSQSPQQHNLHHLDPSIGGGGAISDMMGGSAGGDSGGDDIDGRKGGKRELSQSKRAAQNRAAQRAFRQRKEGYIKKLEEQNREMHTLEENYKAIQTENYSLREYIIHLQSRLIESHGEYPQPPANVNLSHPPPSSTSGSHQPSSAIAPPPPASMLPAKSESREAHMQDVGGESLEQRAISQLQASAAQAVAAGDAKREVHDGLPVTSL